MQCSKPLRMQTTIKNSGQITNNEQQEAIKVRCGKCNNCKLNRLGKGQSRLLLEYQGIKDKPDSQIIFTTLTYNNENLGKTVEDYGTKELQKGIMRLRGRNNEEKRQAANKLKYFGVFERGGQGGRIHHHIILFCENKIIERETGGKRINNAYYFNSTQLKWENGFNSTAIIPQKKMTDTQKVIKYINKYLLKEPLKYVYSQKIGYEKIKDNGKPYYIFDGKFYANPKTKKELSLQEIIDINAEAMKYTKPEMTLQLQPNKEIEEPGTTTLKKC